MSDEEKDTLREHLRKIGKSRSPRKLAALAEARKKSIEVRKKKAEERKAARRPTP